MNRRVTVSSSVAALLILLTSGCWRSQPSGTAVNVQTVQPKRGQIARKITLPATIAPYQQATLYAKVAGYLKSISVDKGDLVKQGQLLAEIEVPELLADQAKFAAEVQVAEVDYKRVQNAQKKAMCCKQCNHAAFSYGERTSSPRVQDCLAFLLITG